MPVALVPAVSLLPNCITQLPEGKGCTSWHFKDADLLPSGQAHGLCHIGPGRPFSCPSHTVHGSMPIGSLCRGAACVPVCAWMHTCVCKGMLLLPLPVVRQLFLCPSQVTFLFISFLPLFSYGRVYTADPYHALAPAASYGVGAVVSGIFFLVLFLTSSMGNSQWVLWNEASPRKTSMLREEILSSSVRFPVVPHFYLYVH